MRTTDEIMKQKRRLFHVLLSKTQQMDAKQYILEGQGVNSTKNLSEKQLDALIDWAGNIMDKKLTEADHETRQWRHKCLRMIGLCGIDTQDWNKVNAFMLDKRIAGRHLYNLTVNELKSLHRKLYNVANNKGRKIVAEQKQAFQN